MAPKALVDCVGRQTEHREEMLASHMDVEGAAMTRGLAEF